MTDMDFHQYANIFPLIEGIEFDELVEDIRKQGLRDPIYTYEGAILDGRNRYRACMEADVAPRFIPFTGDDPIAFVVSLNMRRRHMDASQRAMAGARIKGIFEEQAKARLEAGRIAGGHARHGSSTADLRESLLLPRSQEQEEVKPKHARTAASDAAAVVNISPRSVENASRVLRSGSDELVKAVDTGEIAVSAAAEIAKLPQEQQPEAIVAHNHRAQGTGQNEWYTPQRHIDAARAVLGEFDLDPASSDIANKTVQASKFYTESDNGLNKEWHGKVWLNPPYAQPWIMMFAQKMVDEIKAGRTTEAIALTHNYTDTAWFHLMSSEASALCFTRGRIGFLSPEGEKAAPTQGQAFFYFGKNTKGFAEAFAPIGLVVVRYVF